MKNVKYRSLELLESGIIVDFNVMELESGIIVDLNVPVAWTIIENYRYIILTKFGRPYKFNNVRNSFSTPEEALETLFALRYPDLVEVDS